MRAAALALVAMACGKVPISDVNAGFLIADAAWFAEEQTLFVFWEVEAEQGLGDPSVIEVRYETDAERHGWARVDAVDTVHLHVPVDCGPNTLCGSTSLAVALEPRNVEVRLRYHEDGELALEPRTVFNVVGPGAAHSHRSLLVYGVFDETNTYVQWRSRHLFPTLRNEAASRLGLRREFSVANTGYGTPPEFRFANNPYGYGGACPDGLQPTDLPLIGTSERALFHPVPVPVEASGSPVLCAEATVTDAIGTLTTGAVARRNPEVSSAFPKLRSPVHDGTAVPFFLAPCDREISADHEAMQRQRLELDGLRTTCTDDWTAPGFLDGLVVDLRDAVEAERVRGNDMVLVIGLHQDEPGLADLVEEALAQVVPGERHRSTPRLAGAFVFDSSTHDLGLDALVPVTLWCPANLALDELPNASARSCPTLPDEPELDLGPFSFGFLPILPGRDQYLEFIADFNKRQAGEMLALTYRVPEFATTSDHVDLGEFGVVTFLNGEVITADPDDAFSHCVQDEPDPFVVRSTLMQRPAVARLVAVGCRQGWLPEDVCAVAETGLLPVSALPDWHNFVGEDTYEVGVFWDFPFLLRLEYEARVAASVTALGFTVPFGFGSPEETFYGAATWLEEEFSLNRELKQCRRFCDHPTFDGAGVYQIGAPFRESYAHACYVPDFPAPGDSGFPRDP
ncbi:MAG: hypothetical protein ACI8PZ_002259 [Myxococcota bacterium]|jgi:hypothetical protein